MNNNASFLYDTITNNNYNDCEEDLIATTRKEDMEKLNDN